MKKYRNWIFLCIILLFIVPILLNISFYHLHIPSHPELQHKEWFSFWGSYLSGIIGTAATLLALYVSYQQNKQALDENKRQYQQQREEADIQYQKDLNERQALYEKERKDRNTEQQLQLKALQDQIAQQARLDMMPIFEIRAEMVHTDTLPKSDEKVPVLTKDGYSIILDTFSSSSLPTSKAVGLSFFTYEKESYMYPHIILRNIGNGSVLNCFMMIRDTQISHAIDQYYLRLNSLMPGETKEFFFKDTTIDYIRPHKKTYILDLVYSDVFENKYRQTLEFSTIFSLTEDQYELNVFPMTSPKQPQ